MSEKVIEYQGKKYRVIEEIKESKEVVTKELVVKRLREGYYKFSSDKVNEEFRKDLEIINYDLSKADLSKADLWKANLWKADLSEADLNSIFYKTKVTKEQRKYIMEETDLFELIDKEVLG